MKQYGFPLALIVAGGLAALIFRAELADWFGGGSRRASPPETASVSAGAITIDAALEPDPPRLADNTARIAVRGGDGAAPAVALVAGDARVDAHVSPDGPDRWRAHFDLPSTGAWTLEIVAAAQTARFQLAVGARGLTALGATSGEPDEHAGPMLSPVALAPAGLDAVRLALDAVERIRAELIVDRIDGVAAPAREAAQALRAAAGAQPGEVGDALGRAVTAAEAIAAAADVEAARRGFADLSRELIAIALADPRLQEGWHLFRCPMAEGYQKWMQRTPELANPYFGQSMLTCGNAEKWTAPVAAPAGDPGAISHYTCPMHPQIHQHEPGACPLCGMDLVPVTAEEVASGAVRIDEARRREIGIRTAPVTRAPMIRPIRAVGRVAYDESRLRDVTLKLDGFITRLHVTRTGQPVKKGQLLFTLYSPELYAAQQEYLLARQSLVHGARGEYLVKAAAKKLELWGLSAKQIDALAARGEPEEDMPFYAPASGYVIEKMVVEGDAVEAGERLFRIASLDKVWVEADLYEADLALVKVKQPATVALSYLPDRTFEAQVGYVYPYLDPRSRTGKVRIELPNKGLELKPDMYATVTFPIDLGERLQVPVDAVVYTGPRRLVFVDEGDGRLRPVEVTLGVRGEDVVEITAGLAEGDRVVTSGNFLVAAESRIRSAARIWSEERAEEAP